MNHYNDIGQISFCFPEITQYIIHYRT